jgi:hypothetical protein
MPVNFQNVGATAPGSSYLANNPAFSNQNILTGPGSQMPTGTDLTQNPAFGNQNILGTQSPGGYYTPATTTAPAANPSAWSSFYQGANQFLKSPLGQMTTIGGGGLLYANRANAEAAKLAGSISTLGQPYSQAGAQQLGQITPQLATGTAESSAAANELGQVAMQYGTGQLTPAQQTQVQAYIQQQSAQVDSALAGSGNLNSSARGAAQQQIQNNAAMLTQQLIQGNISMAQGALQSVQSTYSSMLNQALAQSQFGLGAQQAAVALQIQSNTQVSGQLQQLFSALAQGMSGSQGKTGTGQTGQGQGGGNAVQQLLAKLGIKGSGGGNVNQPTNPNAQWTANDPNNPSSQNPYTQLGTNFPGAPIGAADPTYASMAADANNPASAANIQASLSNYQMPNFNITGGDGAQSFGADNPVATGDTGGGG